MQISNTTHTNLFMQKQMKANQNYQFQTLNGIDNRIMNYAVSNSNLIAFRGININKGLNVCYEIIESATTNGIKRFASEEVKELKKAIKNFVAPEGMEKSQILKNILDIKFKDFVNTESPNGKMITEALNACNGKTEKEQNLILNLLNNFYAYEDAFVEGCQSLQNPANSKVIKKIAELTPEIKANGVTDILYQACQISGESNHYSANPMKKFVFDNIDWFLQKEYDDIDSLLREMSALKPEILNAILPYLNKNNLGKFAEEFTQGEIVHPLRSSLAMKRQNALADFIQKYSNN